MQCNRWHPREKPRVVCMLTNSIIDIKACDASLYFPRQTFSALRARLAQTKTPRHLQWEHRAPSRRRTLKLTTARSRPLALPFPFAIVYPTLKWRDPVTISRLATFEKTSLEKVKCIAASGVDARDGTAPREPNEVCGGRGICAYLMAASSSGSAGHLEPDFTVDAHCDSDVVNRVPMHYYIPLCVWGVAP